MRPEQLKNSILQLAIQGKLVEQRKEEGTGEELYKVIQEEKKKLIEEGKIKKQKTLPGISEDEIPFDIPETWKWVRLIDLVSILGDGIHGTPKYSSSGDYYFINGSNLNNGKIELKDTNKRVDKQEWEKYKKDLDLHTILISINGTIGNIAFYNNEKIMLGKSACYFNVILAELKNYLFFLLKSDYFFKYTLHSATGTTIKNVSLKAMSNLLISLPPLAEQKRIVEKIEELLPLVEKYEKAWTRLEELNKKFPQDMKKSILEEAIKGKLVKQRKEEGTGEELFKVIQEEKQKLIEEGKLKKQKALPEINEDEIPFDIPETWKWVRLGEISTYSQSKTKIKISDIDTPMWSLDLEDIEKESGKIISRITTKNRNFSGKKIIFNNGQILYSKLRPYLKKILVAPDNGVCSSEIVPFDMIGNCDSRYIVYVLKSAYVDFFINSVTYGVKMPRVGTETMTKLLIPLPPLAEQKRIVEKIEELLPLCEKLK